MELGGRGVRVRRMRTNLNEGVEELDVVFIPKKICCRRTVWRLFNCNG
jgi:hypothetical protein